MALKFALQIRTLPGDCLIHSASAYNHFELSPRPEREPESMTETKIEKRSDRLKFAGRILFLTEDTSLIRRQLEGEDLQDELAQRLAADDLR